MPSGNQPYGDGGVVWSSAGSTPFEDPVAQMLKLGATLGAIAGTVALSQKAVVGDKQMTAFDVLQKTIRNMAAATPFGIMNTFRLPEFMSPGLSKAVQGEIVIDERFTGEAATRKMIRAAVGDEAFAKSGLDKIDDGNYKLIFEREEGSRARGTLYYQEVLPGVREKEFERVKISDAVAAFELRGPADVLDITHGEYKPKATSPAYMSALQNLGFFTSGSKAQADRILAEVDETGEVIDRARFAFIPSATGPMKTLDDIKRRAAFPLSPLSFGMNRWNRLVDATLEQLPVGSDFAKGLFGADGPLSMKVKPAEASKMFINIGAKATKVWAAGLLLDQADHYRRQFGLPGEVIVSGGISLGLSAILKKNKAGLSPKTIKGIGYASFFGQILLPGFDEGIIPGLATSATIVHKGWATVGSVTGTSLYRRTLEGFLPGISDWKTGAALAVGVTALAYTGVPQKLLESKGSLLPKPILDRIGFDKSIKSISMPSTFSQMYGKEIVEMALDQNRMIFDPETKAGTSHLPRPAPWKFGSKKELQEFLGKDDLDRLNWWDRQKLKKELYRRAAVTAAPSPTIDNVSLVQDELYARRLRAQADLKAAQDRSNPVNDSLAKRINELHRRYGDHPSFVGKAKRQVQIAATQLYHSFFGATMSGEDYKKSLEPIGRKPKIGRVGSLFFGTMALHALFTKGIFGSMESPGELDDIYSGRKLEEIKTGRFWESGGTPFEGMDTSYMRPHQYHLLMTRARERSIWGADEDEISPIMKVLYKNFTYELERRTYHTRPYPMTGTAFSDVPVIGSILGATIGKLIKPPRFMHTSEWMRVGEDGQLELAHRPELHGPSMELGGLPMGIPTSPFSPAFVAANEQYRFREIEGMTGFAKNLVQEMATNTETFGTTHPVFAQAGSMTDPIEKFWEMNIGGGFFLSEPIRRLLPRPRSEISEYNPLLNSMPYWLPNRFKHGDPYRKIEMGWARLPGAGYESIHPELQGVSSDDYPDIYKYSILADVAPQSRATIDLRTELYRRRSQGLTSAAEDAMMDRIDKNLERTMIDRTSNRVHPNAIEVPIISNVTQEAYFAAQGVARNIAAPVEYMMPMGFRPLQKLMSDRDIIEQYEYERLYGTQNAFWDKPWRDWFRPSLYSAAHMMGYDGKPKWRREADESQGYFDQLEFLKWMKLANNPNSSDSDRAYYLRQAQGTRYGVNPMGDAMSVYMSLPESEKKFFDAFAHAKPSERTRILEMIPQDQTHLYKALWSRMDRGEQIAPYSDSPMLQPGDQARLQAAYAEAESSFAGPMPPVDWIGWHEDVEMDDIKAKHISSLGRDLYEYGLYEKQLRMLKRKPYLEDSTAFLYESPAVTRGALTHQLRLRTKGDTPFEGAELYVNSMPAGATRTTAALSYDDDRTSSILSELSSWME